MTTYDEIAIRRLNRVARQRELDLSPDEITHIWKKHSRQVSAMWMVYSSGDDVVSFLQEATA